MNVRRTSLLFALLGVAACGGKVTSVDDPSGGSGSGSQPPPDTHASTPPDTTPPVETTPAPAAVAGIWTMTGQDGPPGELDPGPAPPMQLELAADGHAYRSMCAGSTGSGACAAGSTYDCLAGTWRWDGAVPRVDIPAIRVGGVPEQGEIVPETGGGILVRYINPTYSGGHFTRVAGADAPATCPR